MFSVQSRTDSRWEGAAADEWDAALAYASPALLPPINGNEVEAPLRSPGTLFALGAGDLSEIDIDDIHQGAIGDCFFLAGVAAIAYLNPDVIRNAITENRNPAGEVVSYTVHFFDQQDPRIPKNGPLKPIDITVDATQFAQGGAAFGDTFRGKQELWVKVIEKAYATLSGGYPMIENGWGINALASLQGQVAKGYDGAIKQPFDDLTKELAERRPVVWETYADPGNGLKDSHLYAVLAIKVENGVPMVKVYNPWGTDQPGIPDSDGKGSWITYDLYKTQKSVGVGAPVPPQAPNASLYPHPPDILHPPPLSFPWPALRA
jgi:hypothetical protein